MRLKSIGTNIPKIQTSFYYYYYYFEYYYYYKTTKYKVDAKREESRTEEGSLNEK